MADYGITASGFSVPRMNDIRESIISKIREDMGIELVLTPNSGISEIIDIVAESQVAQWEAAYDVFRSLHPSYAEGANLDLSVGFTNVSRKKAGKTVGYARIWGQVGSTIPEKSEIRDGSSGVIYTTDSEVSVSREKANLIVIEPHMELDTDYVIKLDGHEIKYSSGSTASATSLLKSFTSQIKSRGFNIETSGSQMIVSKQPPETFSFSINQNLLEDEVAVCVAITAQDAGKYELHSGTSLSLVSAISGIGKAEAPFGGVTGSAVETDDDLRARYNTSNQYPGMSTGGSIRSGIENGVLGVQACRVFSNSSNSPDASGRPPHSLHAVVKGGSSREIAEQILSKAPAGIDFFGSESVDVRDEYGESYTVKFDRPEEVFVWVRAEITKLPDNEERYPSNSADAIRSAMSAGANADHNIGTDVVAGRMSSYAYQQPGVAYVKLTLFGTTSSTQEPTDDDFKADNIQIKDNQVAEFDAARISII